MLVKKTGISISGSGVRMVKGFISSIRKKLCGHDYTGTDVLFVNKTIYNKRTAEIMGCIGLVRNRVTKTCTKCGDSYSYDDVLPIALDSNNY